MEATRRQRIEDVVIGVILIGASGIWTLGWGIVAALASGFGSDAFFWVIIAAALAAGIYVFFLGISFVRGSPSLGGIVRFATIGLVVTPVLVAAVNQARDDRAAVPVNHAVEHQYMKRGKFTGVNADCSYIYGRPDGSEWWECDVTIDRGLDYDTCDIDLRRFQAGTISVRITDCISDDP